MTTSTTISNAPSTGNKFVVSANYRDRKSDYKWLVRRYDDPIENAVPFEWVKCANVTFQPSNKDEKGFGCNTVAVCDAVMVRGPQFIHDLPTVDRIREPNDYVIGAFDGSYIARTVPVDSVDVLVLTDNGHMFLHGKTTDMLMSNTPAPKPTVDPTLEYKRVLQQIHQILYSVGGPLNDNKHFFSAPQKNVFKGIARALDSVSYYEEDKT